MICYRKTEVLWYLKALFEIIHEYNIFFIIGEVNEAIYYKCFTKLPTIMNSESSLGSVLLMFSFFKVANIPPIRYSYMFIPMRFNGDLVISKFI
ncbi:hypothetical protein CH378_15170 [Leptospira kmetyi]|uniref:Uncharacterized protein n=1 Tax=Leptospira kmetyi TaxID=408139 RepID=A0ABX4NC17_9LEPT|nr:hypothetical protein CH378_15170 [Leptospira kmetyi]